MPVLRILGDKWTWKDGVIVGLDLSKRVQLSIGAIRQKTGANMGQYDIHAVSGEGTKAKPVGKALDLKRSYDEQQVRSGGAIWLTPKAPAAPQPPPPAREPAAARTVPESQQTARRSSAAPQPAATAVAPPPPAVRASEPQQTVTPAPPRPGPERCADAAPAAASKAEDPAQIAAEPFVETAHERDRREKAEKLAKQTLEQSRIQMEQHGKEVQARTAAALSAPDDRSKINKLWEDDVEAWLRTESERSADRRRLAVAAAQLADGRKPDRPSPHAANLDAHRKECADELEQLRRAVAEARRGVAMAAEWKSDEQALCDRRQIEEKRNWLAQEAGKADDEAKVLRSKQAAVAEEKRRADAEDARERKDETDVMAPPVQRTPIGGLEGGRLKVPPTSVDHSVYSPPGGPLPDEPAEAYRTRVREIARRRIDLNAREEALENDLRLAEERLKEQKASVAAPRPEPAAPAVAPRPKPAARADPTRAAPSRWWDGGGDTDAGWWEGTTQGRAQDVPARRRRRPAPAPSNPSPPSPAKQRCLRELQKVVPDIVADGGACDERARASLRVAAALCEFQSMRRDLSRIRRSLSESPDRPARTAPDPQRTISPSRTPAVHTPCQRTRGQSSDLALLGDPEQSYKLWSVLPPNLRKYGSEYFELLLEQEDLNADMRTRSALARRQAECVVRQQQQQQSADAHTQHLATPPCPPAGHNRTQSTMTAPSASAVALARAQVLACGQAPAMRELASPSPGRSCERADGSQVVMPAPGSPERCAASIALAPRAAPPPVPPPVSVDAQRRRRQLQSAAAQAPGAAAARALTTVQQSRMNIPTGRKQTRDVELPAPASALSPVREAAVSAHHSFFSRTYDPSAAIL